MLVTEKKIIEMMRYHYLKRLVESINETDVTDNRDNIVINKDLKVRHKDSQYEYTVDDVIEDPTTGEVMIQLRLPDEPRIDPSPVSFSDDNILTGDRDTAPHILDEEELMSPHPHPHVNAFNDEDDEGVSVFVIDQEEFEKEYEVK